MKKINFFLLLHLCAASFAFAQFPPPAGQPGTTAIYKDSSVFASWATGVTVVRGYQDISNKSIGYASTGDSTMALGKAGESGVVSLGDGGYAIVTFAHPVTDGPGWDFAVFENGFSDTFLELAFVEVSSDGINYFRFPATSFTQDTVQISGFGELNATKIDNLAGKYRASYGTPFDLQQLSNQPGLDINAVTHVKVIDVVGCIQDEYATYDQYGNKVNDQWNTPFPSGGFDLDAVGVIHQSVTSTGNLLNNLTVNIYPNPADRVLFIQSPLTERINSVTLTNRTGQTVTVALKKESAQRQTLNISSLSEGIYFVTVSGSETTVTKKIIVHHD